MNRYQTALAVLVILFLSSCGKKMAYEIISRGEEQGGLVVSYKVGVPDSYSREDLQGCCDEITQSEGDSVVTNIEFVYADRLT